MIRTIYGDYTIPRGDNPIVFVGELLQSLVSRYKRDSRMRHVRPSDLSRIVYRHELPGVRGDRLDIWKPPWKTVEDGVGDCEDLSTVVACLFPEYSIGVYRGSETGLHAVNVGGDTWEADMDVKVYSPIHDRFITYRDGFGIRDQSWRSGMAHTGIDSRYNDRDGYLIGVSKATQQSDLLATLEGKN